MSLRSPTAGKRAAGFGARTVVAAVFLAGCLGESGENHNHADGGTSPTYRYTVVPLQTVEFHTTQGPQVGQSFVLQVPAAGGKPPYTWTLVSGALPPGLSLSSNGRISGTPTTAGSYSYSLKLTDAAGASVTGDYSENMGTAGTLDFVLILSSLPAYGQDRDVGFVPAVQGSADTLPWTFTITGLPAGLAYDPASGLISGVPTGAFSGQLTVSLHDRNGNQATGSPITVSLQVNAPVLVTPGSSTYDGTYDWFLGPVGGATSSCSGCVFITDGVLSNIEGSFYQSSIDGFGNLSFTGPCPNGNPVAGSFSGTLGGLARPQWQGTWTCADGSTGGPGSPWKIFNQH
jgi:large repetitive protein